MLAHCLTPALPCLGGALPPPRRTPGDAPLSSPALLRPTPRPRPSCPTNWRTPTHSKSGRAAPLTTLCPFVSGGPSPLTVSCPGVPGPRTSLSPALPRPAACPRTATRARPTRLAHTPISISPPTARFLRAHLPPPTGGPPGPPPPRRAGRHHPLPPLGPGPGPRRVPPPSTPPAGGSGLSACAPAPASVPPVGRPPHRPPGSPGPGEGEIQSARPGRRPRVRLPHAVRSCPAAGSLQRSARGGHPPPARRAEPTPPRLAVPSVFLSHRSSDPNWAAIVRANVPGSESDSGGSPLCMRRSAALSHPSPTANWPTLLPTRSVEIRLSAQVPPPSPSRPTGQSPWSWKRASALAHPFRFPRTPLQAPGAAGPVDGEVYNQQI
ncbi:hypothetical protein AWENTII_002039 [Aspergillus wentii]